MKTAITSIIATIMIASTMSFAHAEVPDWVKNNAGWWADGTISESEFLTGIEFLIKENVVVVPPTTVSAQST
ncbi:MAG: peptidase, partial [Nitrosopumilus sp.]|nr:peptidase [Nitrosopumilus sp.]